MKVFIAVFATLLLALGLFSSIYPLSALRQEAMTPDTFSAPEPPAETTSAFVNNPFEARLQAQQQGLASSSAPAPFEPGYNPFQAKLEEQQKQSRTSPFAP